MLLYTYTVNVIEFYSNIVFFLIDIYYIYTNYLLMCMSISSGYKSAEFLRSVFQIIIIFQIVAL